MLNLINKSFGRRSKRDRSNNTCHPRRTSSSSAANTAMITELDLHSFPEFQRLDDDIRKIILSFVADAPSERSQSTLAAGFGPLYSHRSASLTATLPLVNRDFHRYASLDYFWEPALKRQVENEHHGSLWRDGLRRLLPEDYEVTDQMDLIQAVCGHLNPARGFKEIYRKVFTNHIFFDAPVFIMPCRVRIGEPYGLHLFEPRYRIMVRDLMRQCANPADASNGEEIRVGTSAEGVLTPPLLIHACLGSRLAPGEMACLVQIDRCNTYEYGTADVRLVPVAWVQLDRIWVRPNAGHLFYAKALRLPKTRDVCGPDQS
jgi:hypothetical protein